MVTTANELEELARRAIKALDARDQDAFLSAHAEEAILHHPRETYRGIDEIIAFQWAVFEAFPDLTFTIENLLANEELVAARYTATGTHQGAFETIPPTESVIEMRAMAMMRIDDGLIAETWLYPDRLGLLSQLGVVSPAAP